MIDAHMDECDPFEFVCLSTQMWAHCNRLQYGSQFTMFNVDVFEIILADVYRIQFCMRLLIEKPIAILLYRMNVSN